MPRKKQYSEIEMNKVSDILSNIGKFDRSVKQKMEHPDTLSSTIKLVIEKNYSKIKKLYGAKPIEAILDFHIQKEEYEECVQIKKATI